MFTVQLNTHPLATFWMWLQFYISSRYQGTSIVFKHQEDLASRGRTRCRGRDLPSHDPCPHRAMKNEVTITGPAPLPVIQPPTFAQYCINCYRNQTLLQLWYQLIPTECAQKMVPLLIESIFFGVDHLILKNLVSLLLMPILHRYPQICERITEPTAQFFIPANSLLDVIAHTAVKALQTGHVTGYIPPNIRFRTNSQCENIG